MERMRRSSHSRYHNTHWVIGNERVVCAAHTKFLSKLILISWLSKDRLMFVNKYWNKMDYWLMGLAFTLPSQSQINTIPPYFEWYSLSNGCEGDFSFRQVSWIPNDGEKCTNAGGWLIHSWQPPENFLPFAFLLNWKFDDVGNDDCLCSIE